LQGASLRLPSPARCAAKKKCSRGWPARASTPRCFDGASADVAPAVVSGELAAAGRHPYPCLSIPTGEGGRDPRAPRPLAPRTIWRFGAARPSPGSWLFSSQRSGVYGRLRWRAEIIRCTNAHTPQSASADLLRSLRLSADVGRLGRGCEGRRTAGLTVSAHLIRPSAAEYTGPGCSPFVVL
jgi:hypothetical protein